MTVKFTNNANSTLASGINSSVTSMTLADASSFPSLSGANDYCYLTLQESGGTTREIVKATARSSNTFTIVRGQDNTSAATWSSGVLVELRITSALLQDVIDGLGSGSMMDTDIFTGDGSDTTFTLSRQPDNENNLLIFIDGVFQAHNAYSVSGTTLTLSAAPANGRVITAYHMATTVGGSNLIKATMTGDNSDTTLDVGSQIIHENNVQVYFDGVYQSKGNYSVSGSVITFLTAPPTGVAVEAILNTATNISTATQLADADSDTLIQVEESADEDKIRFDTAGTERMVLDSTSLTVTPKIVSDAGIDIDNINIDGTTIALSSGDLTVDVAGEINLDADGGKIRLKDGGTEHLRLVLDNSGFVQLYSAVQDADIKIQGNDGGSVIDALVLDMSEAGAATFNGELIAPNGATEGYHIKTVGGTATPRITNDGNNWTILRPGASGSDVAINNYANSANLVIFTDEGAAGIGTTPKSWNSNFKALQIGPWGSLATTTSGNGESFRLSANFYNDGSAEKYLGSGYAVQFREDVTAGSYIFSSSQASGSADGSIASWYHSEIHNHSWAATLETTTSDGSDNYGVGLDSGGGAGSSARGAGLWVYGNEHSSHPGHLIAQMGASGDFKVMTGASGDERLRIRSNGQVLINTTSGNYTHTLGMRIVTNEVGSNALDAALNLEGSGGDFYAQNWTGPSNVGFGMLAVFSGTTDYLTYRYMSGGTVSYDRFTIYDTGNLSCGGTLTESTSDERLKSNITLISDPIEKIKSIRGVEFDWKETTPDSVGIAVPHAGEHDVGVIAQEVQAILPDAVSHAPFDNDKGESVTGENYLTVNYKKLIPVLVEGMKEQQTLIEELQAEVKALKEA
jgi:hypothetical protein